MCLLAMPGHAQIVSLNLCTDQLLVMLAPEQVTALEPLARDPALSVVARQAARLPSVRADAEAVLRLHPRLVLAGRYGAQTTLSLLRARGLAVTTFGEPADFAAIAAQTMQLARLLGVAERGETLVEQMQLRLAAVHPRTGTAILWEAGGWSAGPGSLGDAVVRAAGLADIGSGGRIGVEALLARHPNWLISETAPATPSMATDLAAHPALATMQHLHVPPELLICGTPATAGAVEALTR